MIKQISVMEPEFKKYGKVIGGYDLKEILQKMEETPCPDDVVYVASVKELEDLKIAEELADGVYGQMPIQIGYCNGYNKTMNAMEYHRSSEINVAATDAVLLVGLRQDLEEDFSYDSSKVEAFFLPEGMAVEVYATTLHYAPCSPAEEGFQVAIVLPKDTNLPLKEAHTAGDEDRLLTATNKWLVAHPDAKIEGAYNGIKGENITIE